MLSQKIANKQNQKNGKVENINYKKQDKFITPASRVFWLPTDKASAEMKGLSEILLYFKPPHFDFIRSPFQRKEKNKRSRHKKRPVN